MRLFSPLMAFLFSSIGAVRLVAGEPAENGSSADQALARYFYRATARIQSSENGGGGFADLKDWETRRPEVKRQLFEMLGLWPLPERTPLQATVTGTVEREDFVVEKVHFQSLPGLYVTGNLYRPRNSTGRLPAVLYVCGHAAVRTNGVSCGNKTAYQHHGIWLARHGAIALLIDTLQLGEIEADHHGTYRLGQWWWNSRGYTPAGVEAWNGIRALDYLVSRADVDPTRLGMTGRSGGGSYTWTTAALDDRVKAAAPVAGITDLENHVLDGTVEGHCDCMFFVNSHRWDFGLNTALMAPRPLLIVNTDSDGIFPLSGVQRIHAQARGVYSLYGAPSLLGLVIGPGPHEDTQDLQVPVFRWFHRHLGIGDGVIRDAAEKLIPPLELRVFAALPEDQRNTRAQEWFGPPDGSWAPDSEDPEAWRRVLRERVFAGWPAEATGVSAAAGRGRDRGLGAVHDSRRGVWRHRTWEFESEPDVPLRLHLLTRSGATRGPVTVRVLDADAAPDWELRALDAWLAGEEASRGTLAILETRGTGAGQWSGEERKQIQIRRRFMLLGQTLDAMRVWDIREGLELVRQLAPGSGPVTVKASGPMAINALMAAFFSSEVGGLSLSGMPGTYREGPDHLNVARVLDWPRLRGWVERRGVRVEVR